MKLIDFCYYLNAGLFVCVDFFLDGGGGEHSTIILGHS